MQLTGTHIAQTARLPVSSTGWMKFVRSGLLRPATLLEVWAQRARQRRHLGELPAERLADIGVSPEAAAGEVSKPFWRK